MINNRTSSGKIYELENCIIIRGTSGIVTMFRILGFGVFRVVRICKGISRSSNCRELEKVRFTLS